MVSRIRQLGIHPRMLLPWARFSPGVLPPSKGAAFNSKKIAPRDRMGSLNTDRQRDIGIRIERALLKLRI